MGLQMAYTDQQVRDYLANVLPNASDREIAAEMVRFGVGADQMARATNQTIENVQNRFEAAQVPVNTPLSDTDVRQYLADRPGYTDAQIAADMIQFGVGPDQISRVTGLPLTDVQARYNAVLGPLQGTVTRPPVVVDTGGSTFVNPAVINIPDSLVPGNVDNRTILQTPPISRETPPTTPVTYISPEPWAALRCLSTRRVRPGSIALACRF